VEEDLAHEVRYLQAYDRAKARLEAWLDLPQPKLSLLVRLVVQGSGELSNTKRKMFEMLSDSDVAKIESAIREEFDEYFGFQIK
jgi:hypothetical protein